MEFEQVPVPRPLGIEAEVNFILIVAGRGGGRRIWSTKVVPECCVRRGHG